MKHDKTNDYTYQVKLDDRRKGTMEEKRTRGRPKIQIDYQQAEQLASIWCTEEEIASILGCSVRTLQRDEEFCRVYKKGLNQGKMSLRRTQVASAMDGNVTMQIWLGKQYLGQRDQVEIDDHRLSKIDTLIESIDEKAKE